MKAEFPDANHNCWASLLGPPGSTDRIGLSDHGEPHGVPGLGELSQGRNSGDLRVAKIKPRELTSAATGFYYLQASNRQSV